MPYRIAGSDVHKKMLAVAVADVEVDGDFQFEREKVGTTPSDLHRRADWLIGTKLFTNCSLRRRPRPTCGPAYTFGCRRFPRWPHLRRRDGWARSH